MYILTPYTIQSFCIAISSRFRINPFPIRPLQDFLSAEFIWSITLYMYIYFRAIEFTLNDI